MKGDLSPQFIGELGDLLGLGGSHVDRHGIRIPAWERRHACGGAGRPRGLGDRTGPAAAAFPTDPCHANRPPFRAIDHG
jgi:hypothetical protein